jgi:hypothetical protein
LRACSRHRASCRYNWRPMMRTCRWQ